MARHITATPGVIRIEFPIRARTKTAAPVLDVIRPNELIVRLSNFEKSNGQLFKPNSNFLKERIAKCEYFLNIITYHYKNDYNFNLALLLQHR